MAKSYEDPAKQEAREKLGAFIGKNLGWKLRRKPEQVKILCFPGAEQDGEVGLELEIYDALGIPRANITGLEMDRTRYGRLRQADLGIELTEKPMKEIDFLQQNPRRKWDIISLDYTCYLDVPILYTLNFISQKGMLADNGILCTNFLAKRESPDAQEGVFESNVKSSFANMVMQQAAATNATFRKMFVADIDRFRELCESIVGEQVVFDLKRDRSDVIQRSVYGCLFTGNTSLSLDYARDILNVDDIIKGTLDFCRKNPEFQEELDETRATPGRTLEEKMAYNISFRGLIRDMLFQALFDMGIPTELANLYWILKARPYFVDSAESYDYVSNSRSRMMLDMVYTERYSQELKQFEGFFRFNGNQMSVGPLSMKRTDLTKAYKFVGRVLQLSPEALAVKTKRDYLGSSASNGVPALEERVEEVASEPAKIEDNGEAVYQAIEKGMQDDEITGTYGITTRQLGAYKAWVTMRGGDSRKKQGLPSEDKEAIAGLLKEGYSTQEVHSLVQGECSVQQIGGIKAALTKKDKIREPA